MTEQRLNIQPWAVPPNANNAKLAAQNNDLKANADKVAELSLTVALNKKKMDNDRLLPK